ncbi:alkaline phosphatase D family protein [Streptomyces tropicalis]|uniref:Alkaline phosphatase D family protein n=1 Tax=Streptomyces tropicalis TaxID=3034234 RepID=A0ABT5ZYL7_9ACTN|nr:alkaline phosphatase D family protein [Streptomyces tropicalis]MDF3297484.1 alkaline phosphatase D family protein [Streptomyces tropicalis]
MTGTWPSDRRRLLAGGAAVVGAAAAAPLWRQAAARAAGPRLPEGVFGLGIASGDPLPDGVVLWTRLAPEPLHGGGMPDRALPVEWEVAGDERFAQVVRRGVAAARPGCAHSVHVEVHGLRPDRPYWYRFRAGGRLSPTGRTRTAPGPRSSPGGLRLALASCQNWQHGYFTPYADILRQDPDVVLFVGDYIYESAPSATAVRRHAGRGEPHTLEQYRNRYAQYRTDPDLAAMHARAPWVVAFDDHEVDNDFAGRLPQDPGRQSHAAFTARLTAAFRAYYEHMPLRAAAAPSGPHLRMHRRLDFGRLARLHVLDTRQYRSGRARTPQGARSPSLSMLGGAQRRWLRDGLRDSPARWNLVASQVMMAEADLRAGPGTRWYYDAWDGYRAERTALLRQFRSVRNPVVLSGDRHLTMVSDLREDFTDPGSAVVGAEFTGTSVSSNGDEDQAAFHALWEPRRADNPHWKLVDAHRGYHLLDIGRDGIDARVRVVDTVLRPSAAAGTAATLRVEAGRPGVELVRAAAVPE